MMRRTINLPSWAPLVTATTAMLILAVSLTLSAQERLAGAQRERARAEAEKRHASELLQASLHAAELEQAALAKLRELNALGKLNSVSEQSLGDAFERIRHELELATIRAEIGGKSPLAATAPEAACASVGSTIDFEALHEAQFLDVIARIARQQPLTIVRRCSLSRALPPALGLQAHCELESLGCEFAHE